MSIIETEIVESIMGQLHHVVERIEHELGAHPHFADAQSHAMSAHMRLRSFLAEKRRAELGEEQKSTAA